MDDPLKQTPGQAPVRRYPRMTADCVVAFRRKLADGAESAPQFSRTRSIGLGGLMFETEGALQIGESVALEIVIGEDTIRASGVVAYTDRREDGLWQNGIQFTEITDQDRDILLSAYLQREYRIGPT